MSAHDFRSEAEAMQEGIYRKSLIGGVAGGALFALLALYLNLSIGAGVFAHPGPVAVMAVIGGTVGALVAPLFPSREDRGG